jgi:hypothetical protein
VGIGSGRRAAGRLHRAPGRRVHGPDEGDRQRAALRIGAYAVLSLAAEREAFGVALPEEVPLWAGILFLVFLYQSAAWPLHAARRASYQARGGPHHAAVAALDGLLSMGVGIFIVWLAWQNLPEVRELLRSLPDLWDSMRR